MGSNDGQGGAVSSVLSRRFMSTVVSATVVSATVARPTQVAIATAQSPMDGVRRYPHFHRIVDKYDQSFYLTVRLGRL